MTRRPLSIIDIFNTETSYATEFRRILQTVLKKQPDQERKSLLITSSTLSEGKSTVSSLLAIAAAKKNMKTLLIDSDMRRPSLHKLFLSDQDNGLSEMLTNGLSIKAATRVTSLENLDLITAGQANAHPSEIFDSAAIGRIIEEAKFYYDLIIVDSAPIIPVSDPMLLSQEVDGIILVVRAGHTQRDVVIRATEIIAADRSRVLGVVLNNVNASLPYYYDDRYYGYQYDARPDPVGRSRGSKRSGKNNGSSESGKNQPKDQSAGKLQQKK